MDSPSTSLSIEEAAEEMKKMEEEERVLSGHYGDLEEDPDLDQRAHFSSRFPLSVDNFQKLLENQDSMETPSTATPDEAGPSRENGVVTTPNGITRKENGSNGPKEKKRKEPPVDELPPSVFDGVVYLGCSKMDSPSDEKEMHRLMKFLDEEKTDAAITVRLSVSRNSSGTAKLFDGSGGLLVMFPLFRVRYCVRGENGTAQSVCFALSYTHNTPNSVSAAHQCHVFRAPSAEVAGRALFSFSEAFRHGMESSAINGADPSRMECRFEAYLQILENDAPAGSSTSRFATCPQQHSTFKMRRDLDRKVLVRIKQVTGKRLTISKCFGILIAAGRNLRQCDLQLLELEEAAAAKDDPTVYTIRAAWDPRGPNFTALNTETPRDTRVFITVAMDVIVCEVNEPIRFSMEAKARVFHQHERFCHGEDSAAPIVEGFFLNLSRSPDPSTGGLVFLSLDSNTERVRQQSQLGRSPSKMPAQLIHPAPDDESDSDEPLLSGSGLVSQECAEDVMEAWKNCVEEWRNNEDGARPSSLASLIANGVPDMLRGEVWQLLAKVHLDKELKESYQGLLEKDCLAEQVILRDIHRTFPAHEYFKASEGDGQQKLYRISKAYAIHDEEVSYCQGLSFLAASLLLHMPEDEAFCTLVKIMFDFQLRDLFKLGFDSLHLRFYQLNALIKDYESELFVHLDKMGVETHMYASQWFLTLFTAKFPLQMVFFIIDLFLSQGMPTIFHISLALLKDSKRDLLQLDFEGILKYFRVTLPRRYRTEANARSLIQRAVELKISHKKLAKYEADYVEMKEREAEAEDPTKRLQRENDRYCKTIIRLEQENDDLAHELVTSKIELRRKLDTAEDELESAKNAVERLTRANADVSEENRNLLAEYEQLKEMCRREVERLEIEGETKERVANEYKGFFAEQAKRAEREREEFDKQKKAIMSRISSCDSCWSSVQEWEANRSPARSPQEEMGINDLLTRLEEREAHVRAVELELAQTKLLLVEEQCRNQDLSHQMTTSMSGGSGMESEGKKWLKKTMASLKDVRTSLKYNERTNSAVSVSDR
ncbi:hypothetical protein PMAYCL1PPCAC_01943 [Pristionchus mayeri]|uniref:Rab-GAP TBC domain-containing protein n=1 Tax=Pristionchus mayeri TaxID=1317129 RepID=A0AAN4Z0F8_9BILA|nr:hypothetical protein PMAYCL1PPCAC_01943 [Pristionchus mayeri]